MPEEISTMHNSWLKLIDRVLRPGLDSCRSGGLQNGYALVAWNASEMTLEPPPFP